MAWRCPELLAPGGFFPQVTLAFSPTTPSTKHTLMPGQAPPVCSPPYSSSPHLCNDQGPAKAQDKAVIDQGGPGFLLPLGKKSA